MRLNKLYLNEDQETLARIEKFRETGLYFKTKKTKSAAYITGKKIGELTTNIDRLAAMTLEGTFGGDIVNEELLVIRVESIRIAKSRQKQGLGQLLCLYGFYQWYKDDTNVRFYNSQATQEYAEALQALKRRKLIYLFVKPNIQTTPWDYIGAHISCLTPKGAEIAKQLDQLPETKPDNKTD